MTTPDEVALQDTLDDVQLPPRPKLFRGACDFVDRMPDDVRPKRSPRNVEYLGAAEWAWSPVSSREDKYYISRRKGYWLLWIRWQDDNDWEAGWQWTLYGYARTRRADLKTAAVYLLMDAWQAEKDHLHLDHYFLVDEGDVLSEDELEEIARQVWPEASSPSESDGRS